VFPAFKKGISVKKVFLKGLVFGGLVLLMTSLTDILVLGDKAASGFFYPTYSTFSTVHVGDFAHRMEALVAIAFVIAVFLKLSILLLGACNGAARLFGVKDYRDVIMPMTFLIIAISLTSFDTMIYFHEWTDKVFRWYASFFEILVPLTLLIIIQIKIKTNNMKVKG